MVVFYRADTGPFVHFLVFKLLHIHNKSWSRMHGLNNNLYLILILKNGLGLAGWFFLLGVIFVAVM